ncbi:hypothetical protein COLO4_16317 [Corchorus olitorius]|uniref:Uncharacterized protein n=1 Tax=Corchorus olitorius TaxID=93759 RepID=A0A1R3JI15_9ROSI|nr:hypothetical protein COLO4_16317 [Corchorus olitorius]
MKATRKQNPLWYLQAQDSLLEMKAFKGVGFDGYFQRVGSKKWRLLMEFREEARKGCPVYLGGNSVVNWDKLDAHVWEICFMTELAKGG